ncbi:TetR family transcriptional regulator, partial [Nonomuraea sp. RK-328]|nr:TetR family transcriptional regulator [Nonomuraea sp. RK-328]
VSFPEPVAPSELTKRSSWLVPPDRFWQPIAVPDTGSLRDDAIGFLRNANADRAPTITLMSVQLVDYFRDAGTSFGDLPGLPRSPRVVNLPFDLLRHDLVTTMRAVPDESIVEIVDEVWLPLLGAIEGEALTPP